jgi:3-dehydroquinate dehydratase type I
MGCSGVLVQSLGLCYVFYRIRPFLFIIKKKGKNVEKICIPIVETTMGKALRSIKEVNRWADLIELRVDYLRGVKLALLLENRQKPFIVTNRKREEGGKYKGTERERLGVLRRAIDLGADYIDVEFTTGRSILQGLIRDKKETQVILSFHDFRETPSLKELQRLSGKMIQLGADVIKIVPFARSLGDNLNILSLIPFVKEKKQKIVAFCMGERGKISRIFSPFLGAAWTYASLNQSKASAPGQLTIRELRVIWEKMR